MPGEPKGHVALVQVSFLVPPVAVEQIEAVKAEFDAAFEMGGDFSDFVKLAVAEGLKALLAEARAKEKSKQRIVLPPGAGIPAGDLKCSSGSSS